jgi:hypothetical protein
MLMVFAPSLDDFLLKNLGRAAALKIPCSTLGAPFVRLSDATSAIASPR